MPGLDARTRTGAGHTSELAHSFTHDPVSPANAGFHAAGVKAPAFALIIGIVGCHAGMQVGNSAESLGRMTSNAVVTTIFAVIVADALFSIFFAQVGI